MMMGRLRYFISRLINKDNRLIYTLNTRDNFSIELMKSYFNLDNKEVFVSLNTEFDLCIKRLKMKDINYYDLKKALIPNQDKDKKEICLVFDREQMGSWYGREVFTYLLPLFNKESTYSIFHGDYIDRARQKDSQDELKNLLFENLVEINKTKWIESNQFYLVYFNCLSNKSIINIIEGLKDYKGFIGYKDVSYRSIFKSYIGTILVNLAIKNKDNIILSHSEDYKDEENVNIVGYPFEKNGFRVVSINELSYINFLSYKIESLYIDEDDMQNSFNILSKRPSTISNMKLIVKNKKWKKYLTVESGKGEITKSLGYLVDDKERFIKEIKNRIDRSYIYNLTINENGMKFNVCVEHPTIGGHIRKTVVALKYCDILKRIRVITIT